MPLTVASGTQEKASEGAEMGAGNIWLRVVLVIIAVLVAIRVVSWALAAISNVVNTALTIAIVVGVVWLVFHLLTRRKQAA
ncbi:MAG TPA: hypothetical protein VLH79_04090 [Chthonomonadales bacterium]|nr:hypothetical protein [Chthonomonadales bacterium]